VTDKAVLGFAFTFVAWVWLLKLRRFPVATHVERRAWVVKEDEKHFTPEMFVSLVVDETTKGAACLSECGRSTGVAKKCRDDNDLFDELRWERGKRSPEVRHAPAAETVVY